MTLPNSDPNPEKPENQTLSFADATRFEALMERLQKVEAAIEAQGQTWNNQTRTQMTEMKDQLLKELAALLIVETEDTQSPPPVDPQPETPESPTTSKKPRKRKIF